jgi:NAD(P)-dependent dehydrogenase (short-subunit alcohol dehydrogenase family)
MLPKSRYHRVELKPTYLLDSSSLEASVNRAAEEALKIYGRIDVVAIVNNASYSQPGIVKEFLRVLCLLIQNLQAYS